MKHLFLSTALLCQIIFFFFNIQKIKAEWHFSRMDLDGAIKATPYNYRFHMLKGTLYLRDKQPSLAELEFKETLRYFPYYFDAAGNLGVALAQKGEIEQAERIFRVILQSWPAHKESRENLSIIEKIKG